MTPHIPGSVEVICGSMFSGKTDELIRRLRRATIARQHVQVFKPAIDMRYAVEKVTSHAGSDFDAIPIGKAAEIRARLDEQATVVAIDEAQFFDDEIVRIVEELADKQLRVIVAGLDTDFRGEPFGPMPELMARAEQVNKLQAICMVCGEPASRTQRLVNGKPARVGVPGKVVQDGQRGRCARNLRIDRDPEPPGHVHGLDHLGDGFFYRILRLMRWRTGQTHPCRYSANRRDQLVYLVPHQQTS